MIEELSHVNQNSSGNIQFSLWSFISEIQGGQNEWAFTVLWKKFSKNISEISKLK